MARALRAAGELRPDGLGWPVAGSGGSASSGGSKRRSESAARMRAPSIQLRRLGVHTGENASMPARPPDMRRSLIASAP